MRSDGHVRTLVDRHPVALDVLIAFGLLAIASMELIARRGEAGPGWLFAPLLTMPLLWRRRAPSAVFVVIALAAFGQWLVARPTWADLALLVALYTVAATEPRGRALAAGATLELGVVLAVARWSGRDPLAGTVFLTGMVIAAGALGRSMQIRRAYLRSLEERAARLEHERDQQGQIAAAAERARIAREMHDIVAHNLSVMTALADGAAYAVRSDPEQASRAMDLSAQTGRQALADMRRLLGVLREDNDAERTPQPGTEDVPELLAQVRAAGLPVTLAVEGAHDALPPAAQLTLFRLIQEALTNSLKHAGPGATAAIALRYDADVVELDVSDTGRGAVSPNPGGQGLSGMRERAAVYAGVVEAGPRPEGGWRVRARLNVPRERAIA
ncbi:MAG TPA: histidine kinase [Conexibacter sp.]|jgi:signal transduction histidine kinase|nr:histidine kinase [Conexibacter sp.]